MRCGYPPKHRTKCEPKKKNPPCSHADLPKLGEWPARLGKICGVAVLRCQRTHSVRHDCFSSVERTCNLDLVGILMYATPALMTGGLAAMVADVPPSGTWLLVLASLWIGSQDNSQPIREGVIRAGQYDWYDWIGREQRNRAAWQLMTAHR